MFSIRLSVPHLAIEIYVWPKAAAVFLQVIHENFLLNLKLITREAACSLRARNCLKSKVHVQPRSIASSHAQLQPRETVLGNHTSDELATIWPLFS